MRMLVIDGANVIGSRPDGWWRDRPGAARRLWGQLVAMDVPYDQVVLVLEGAARQGVPAGLEGSVRTIHASASGDDAIVESTGAWIDEGAVVAVVTADRGLQERVTAVGATVRRPTWLLERL